MSPAPSIAHQEVAGRFFARLERALLGKPCRPFVAPTGVRLSETDVVQPDILVVRDPAKITDAYIDGAPEVVVEVLSPVRRRATCGRRRRSLRGAGFASTSSSTR